MSERASYSRVYWSIVDDPKFESVYDNDSHLAAWLRLLLIADQAHPASAHLPSNVRRGSVKLLSDVGLIDLAGGSRYRVHGLDAEREKRRLAATSRPPKGPVPSPSGSHSGTERSPNGPGTTGLRRDEGETRRDETNARADNDPWDDPEREAIVWLAKHGCDVRPGNGYHQKLILAVEQHGINAVVGMLDRLAEAGVHNGDIKGFLFGAIDRLNEKTRPALREVAASEREDERQETLRRRLEKTKELAHENGFHQEPDPGCPVCVKRTVAS